jgi:hypothetical protein
VAKSRWVDHLLRRGSGYMYCMQAMIYHPVGWTTQWEREFFIIVIRHEVVIRKRTDTRRPEFDQDGTSSFCREGALFR